jgi:hypothetical protein
MRIGNHLSPFQRNKLISDSKWWIELLSIWSNNLYLGNEYKIYSASEIQKPQQVYILQSDSSGTDGFGYHSGYLEDSISSQLFVSRRWKSYMFTECNQINAEYSSAKSLFLAETQPPKPAVSFSKNSKDSFSKKSQAQETTSFLPGHKISGIQNLEFLENLGDKTGKFETLTLSAAAKIFTPKKINTSFNITPTTQQLPQSSIWGEIYALKDFLQTT